MKTVIAITGALIGAAMLSGCTDATQAGFAAYGSPHEITCWNYHQQIYHGFSTGRISHDKQGSSDTISFENRETRKLDEIMLGQSSTCVIRVAD
jgi:hypothetical protein